MKKPKSFAIWGNTDKPKFWDTLPGILKWAKNNKLNPHLTTRIDKNLKDNKYPIIQSGDDFSKMDFISSKGY